MFAIMGYISLKATPYEYGIVILVNYIYCLVGQFLHVKVQEITFVSCELLIQDFCLTFGDL